MLEDPDEVNILNNRILLYISIVLLKLYVCMYECVLIIIISCDSVGSLWYKAAETSLAVLYK